MPTRVQVRSIAPLLLGAVLVLAGCGVTREVISPRTWTMTAAMTSGRTHTVQVRDDSGRIENAEIDADSGPFGDVANPPGQPNVVLVNWIGGACDERTDITVSSDGNGLLIEIRITMAQGDCDAIGIGHTLRLTGSGPLPAGAITVRTMPAGS